MLDLSLRHIFEWIRLKIFTQWNIFWYSLCSFRNRPTAFYLIIWTVWTKRFCMRRNVSLMRGLPELRKFCWWQSVRIKSTWNDQNWINSRCVIRIILALELKIALFPTEGDLPEFLVINTQIKEFPNLDGLLGSWIYHCTLNIFLSNDRVNRKIYSIPF